MVIEATGQFRSGDGARKHIARGGARKVVISVSADEPDAFLILGANHESYDAARHDVVSPASCGVNALTVMAKGAARPVRPAVGEHLRRTRDPGLAEGARRPDRHLPQRPRLSRATDESIIPHNYVVGDLVSGWHADHRGRRRQGARFDNEWGFSNRLLDLARLVGDRRTQPAVRSGHPSWSVV